jgi:pimeloyl-ACP methyl ester carboxylesterase
MGSVLAKSFVERCTTDMIYHPPPSSYQRASVHFIKSVRGDKLALRCVSPAGASMSLHSKYRDSRHVILYSHGNATDLGECSDICELLSGILDAHVIVYDYPNYGASSKTAMCESALTSSIESVYARCIEIEIPREKIILMGQSLGSVPTLHLASRVYAKYGAIVLISPLASAFRTVIDGTYVPSFLVPKLDGLLFNNLLRIETVHAPVAIVHGFDDDVIDISSAELLHSRIPRGFQHSPLYLSAGHNDIYDKRHLLDVTKYLQTFLQSVQASSSGEVNLDALPD